MTAEIDWAAFPGPVEYVPAAVPAAFELMRRATNEREANAAYHAMLFAIGNDHRGTLYPVAVAALPEIIQLTHAAAPWTRWAAVQILTDCLTSFEPEPGFEVVTLANGQLVDVQTTVRAQITSSVRNLRSNLDSESDAAVRNALMELVEAIEDAD